jgi:hypothetical protein
MAKPARGLPSSFELNLPEEGPVQLGDFLEEELPMPVARKSPKPSVETHERLEPQPSYGPQGFTPHIVPARTDEERAARPVQRKAQSSKVIRYQLNLTPKSKTMFEELVKHVQTFSPEGDTRTSEVFQGIIGILHGAMDELDLADLPRRGAWGSVTAKNFPNALGEAFEQAIVRTAKRRG